MPRGTSLTFTQRRVNPLSFLLYLLDEGAADRRGCLSSASRPGNFRICSQIISRRFIPAIPLIRLPRKPWRTSRQYDYPGMVCTGRVHGENIVAQITTLQICVTLDHTELWPKLQCVCAFFFLTIFSDVFGNDTHDTRHWK